MKNWPLFLILFLVNSSLLAKPFGLRVMANYNSQQVYRGAVTWPKPTAIAGPMLVFYDRLFVAGPNIFYTPTTRLDDFQWRVGVNFWDDNDPPIHFGDHEEDYRNKRSSSLELQTQFQYNFGWRKRFNAGAFLAREVKENIGLHSEVFLGAPLLPFTSVQARLSFSEKKMNKYLYGPTGVSGAGYSSFSFNGIFPFVPWNGMIMVNYTRFIVLKGENKTADYIRSDDINDVVSVRLFWNAL